MKKTKLSLFLLILWGLISTQSLPAQIAQRDIGISVFTLEEWQDVYTLNKTVGIHSDGGIIVTIENVEKQLQNTAFQSLDQLDFELLPHQYYWGKILLKNNLPDATNYTEWILQFTYSITEIDLFAQQSDGTYRQYLSGEYRPYHLKSYKPALDFNLFRVTLPSQQVIQLYFRAKADRNNVPPDFKVALRHSTSFAAFLQKRKTNHYFFVGFVAMMLLYNLIGAFIKRDRSFIFHSVYLITLIVHSSNATGDIEDWFGPYLFPNHPEYAYCFNLVIIIGVMAYLGFMRSFLNLNQLMSRWDQFFKYLFWLGVPFIIVHIIITLASNFSHGVADYVPTTYLVLFLLPSFLFIYHLYKTKDKKGQFIVAGMFFLFVGVFFNFLLWTEVVSAAIFGMKTGFILEIFIFSLGLAYREQENVKAKEKAHFQLEKNKFLQEQEQAEFIRHKKLNQLKSRFYTNITHEFRTPLTVIMGINENIIGHSEQKNLIRRNSKSLLRLINQLLDLSKAESATLQVHKTKGNIVTYLQYLTESFYSMATDKGIRLTFYSEVDTLDMEYDETKIQHIFYNLLSNAIKFTEADGKVILHLNTTILQKKSFLKIKIQDTGIGISADVLPHIFDRFYQVDNSNTRKGEGTGIGLALVKELVQLIGGQIEVKSTEEKGTEFLVYLPIEEIRSEKESVAQILISENDQKVENGIEETSSVFFENNKLTKNLPLLLIIEDNKDVVLYIQSILTKDYIIQTAKNGQLGIEKAIEIIPDIIISDVMMPIKDGYEVCEILKKDERTSHVPIILLTAKATQSDKIEGLKYGADAFLTKPFHQEELLIRLQQLIALRKELQLRYSQQSMLIGIDTPPQEQSTFIQKLQTLVESKLDNPDFGVADLGKAVQMSDMQIYRKLKALTNQTPSIFIRSIRLQKGKALLKNTDLTIAEIAYTIGFNNPNYFSRTFHQEFGQPPSAFRK